MMIGKKNRWDLVLVDAESDGKGTGIELGRMVQQLKELKEGWEATPILPRLVLMTSVSGAIQVQQE